MKRGIAGAFLVFSLLALPAMAQRGMSAGHGFGEHGSLGGLSGRGVFAGGAVGGRGFAPRGFVPHGFVSGGFAPHGFVPHTGILVRGPHGSVVIRTGPFPHGHFHHGHTHPFFPNSFCSQSPFLCGSAFGFNPFFADGWYGAWGGYGYPYAYSYPDTYGAQVQSTLGQQQQEIAVLEEQIRAEQLSRMEADAAQPAPAPATAQAPTNRAAEPVTPTILVFRDRHQAEVQNYAIVGNTLYESAPRWTRRISLADLDLPATMRANEERGVKFRVPSRAQVVTQP